MLDAEDEVNQKIAHLIFTMSDVAIYIVDVEQFATIEQLKVVIQEANDLMRDAVNFFNKYKDRGSFGDYFLIDSISRLLRFIYLSNLDQQGFSLPIFHRTPRMNWKNCRRVLLDSKTSLIADCRYKQTSHWRSLNSGFKI